jgi:hypothetical protein
MSFPTIVYKCPGAHQREGGTYDYQGVADEDVLTRALSDGWFITLPEAVEGKTAEIADPSMPIRQELESKANELGIKFDGRTTDKSLADKIEIALADQEQ